jgi:hypothetical protein
MDDQNYAHTLKIRKVAGTPKDAEFVFIPRITIAAEQTLASYYIDGEKRDPHRPPNSKSDYHSFSTPQNQSADKKFWALSGSKMNGGVINCDNS